ncbi:hypothetical protein D3C78_1220130 [compost metagenome]
MSRLKKGGPSLNPLGRPRETEEQKANKLKKSKLRKAEAELMKLNPRALENIRKSVEGEDIDKEIVNTSKWVVTTTVAVSKAALQEELEINGLKDTKARAAAEDAQADEEESDQPTAEFSMTMRPTAAQLKAV